MKIRYKGGRTWFEVVYSRKSYHFTKENNRILDIKEIPVVNYIFSLPNRGEFEVVEEAEEKIEPKPLAKKVEEKIKETKEIFKQRGRPKKGGRR